jgi:hypothetical protein
MRNYEEFKGIPYRLDFDAASKCFVYVALADHVLDVSPEQKDEVILLSHKNTPQRSCSTPLKKRRVA